MKNITLFKTKITSVLLAVISGFLALTVHPGFSFLFFLSLFFILFAFLMPIISKANMTRLKHLQDASGGDMFID